MTDEKKIEEQFSEYRRLAKENRNVDVASLMINALEHQGKNLVSLKQKKWAYLLSVVLPPLGFLFAFRYYFGEEEDGRQVAYTCVALTVVAGLVYWFTVKTVFTGGIPNPEQIQKVTFSDILLLIQRYL